MAILDFSVSGWHGFGSVTQVCFGISVSNSMCMSFVDVGRSLTIVSYVAFKMAAFLKYLFNRNMEPELDTVLFQKDDRCRLCRDIYYLRLSSYTRSIVSRGICGSIVLLAVINPTQWAISQNLMLLITLFHYIPAEAGKNRAHAFYNVPCICLARRCNSYAWVCTNEHF